MAGGLYFKIPKVYWLGANGTSWSGYYSDTATSYIIGGCGGDGWFPGLLRKTHQWNFSWGSVGNPNNAVTYVPAPRIYNDLGTPWHNTSAQTTIPQNSIHGGAGNGEDNWFRGGGLGGRGYGAGGGGGMYSTNSGWGTQSGGCSGQLASYMHVLTDTSSYAVTIGAAVTASAYQGAGAPGCVAVFW